MTFIFRSGFLASVCIFFSLTAVLQNVSASPSSVSTGSDSASPQGMVSEMIGRLKSERDPAVLLEYVHWDTAFRNFPEDQRREIQVSNPAEFRGYFEGFFRDPADFVQRQMQSRMSGMSSDQKQMLEAQFKQLANQMLDKRRRMDEKMSRAEYRIGEVEVEGNAATVELITTLDGQTRAQTLPLELINGRWFLPTMKFVESSSASGLPD